MKILLPTIDYPPIEGGIGTIARELSCALAHLGHEVTIVAPFFPEMNDFDAAEPVRVKRFGGYDLGWARWFPFARSTWPELQKHDAVIALNAAYAGLLASFAQTPYVALAYGYEFLKFADGPALPRALVRRAFRRADAVAAISTFTRDKLAAFGVDAAQIHVLRPGAHPVSRTPDHAVMGRLRNLHGLAGKRIILGTGRLVRRKGFDTLVQALPKVLESIPATVLAIAGRGPDESRIRQQIERLGLQAHTRLLRKVSDAERDALYGMADVFALLPREEKGGQVEGFGLVYAEAAAHGLPVLATRSGGIPDAVLDGETGLLVNPDDADAAASAIIRMLDDSAFARRLGDAGRRRVENELNWSQFALGVTALLERAR